MKPKRYRLKYDLPTFKAGDEFELAPCGALVQITNGRTGVCAYTASTLEKFPNILTDWFEEIKETTRWKPESNHMYCFIRDDCDVYYDIWTGDIDQKRFDLGNCFQTKEEAERVVEYLKALAVVRGDATTKFVRGKSNYYVVYNTTYNCLDVSDNCYLIKNGIFGLPYFATEEDAQKSIELHRKEWLTIFGVKEEDEATQ